MWRLHVSLRHIPSDVYTTKLAGLDPGPVGRALKAVKEDVDPWGEVITWKALELGKSMESMQSIAMHPRGGRGRGRQHTGGDGWVDGPDASSLGRCRSVRQFFP